MSTSPLGKNPEDPYSFEEMRDAYKQIAFREVTYSDAVRKVRTQENVLFSLKKDEEDALAALMKEQADFQKVAKNVKLDPQETRRRALLDPGQA